MNKLIMFLCLFMFLMVTFSQAFHDGRKVYIVYLGATSSHRSYLAMKRHHFSLLRSIIGRRFRPGLIVSNYWKTFHGFAAWLTEEECKRLSAMPEVVSVFPNLNVKLNTDVMKDGAMDSGLRAQPLAPL